MATNGFSINAQGMVSVTYTVTEGPAPPFSIGIYGSPDGVQPATLLQTYEIDDTNLLGDGTHTVTFAPDFSGAGNTAPYLVAMLDAYNEVYEVTKTDNVLGLSVPSGGANSKKPAGTFT